MNNWLSTCGKCCGDGSTMEDNLWGLTRKICVGKEGKVIYASGECRHKFIGSIKGDYNGVWTGEHLKVKIISTWLATQPRAGKWSLLSVLASNYTLQHLVYFWTMGMAVAPKPLCGARDCCVTLYICHFVHTILIMTHSRKMLWNTELRSNN